MKKCGEGCYAICDNCKHFYGRIETNFDGEQIYKGEGVCELDNSNKNAFDRCNKFVCQNVKN